MSDLAACYLPTMECVNIPTALVMIVIILVMVGTICTEMVRFARYPRYPLHVNEECMVPGREFQRCRHRSCR